MDLTAAVAIMDIIVQYKQAIMAHMAVAVIMETIVLFRPVIMDLIPHHAAIEATTLIMVIAQIILTIVVYIKVHIVVVVLSVKALGNLMNSYSGGYSI